MRKLIIITSLVCLISNQVWGQNYIGMSQTKIIRDYGNPDVKGDDYIAYQDVTEDGTNKYYFGNDNKCTSFVLIRNVKYFEEYVKLLNKEFRKSSSHKYISKSKSRNFKAEIVEANNEFEIRISLASEEVQQTDNKTAHIPGQNENCF